MKTTFRTFVGLVAGFVWFAPTAAAQSTAPAETLETVLYRSIDERMAGPMLFSTRDSIFVLSLPDDEPAEIYLQITVRKNGRVRERLTRVNANHIGTYVAPAFIAATKNLRVDRALLQHLSRQDTSLIISFPMAYQCTSQTLSKAWPNAGDYVRESLRSIPENGGFANHCIKPAYSYPSIFQSEAVSFRMEDISRGNATGAFSRAEYQYKKAVPTPIWYYTAFIRRTQE